MLDVQLDLTYYQTLKLPSQFDFSLISDLFRSKSSLSSIDYDTQARLYKCVI